ncbi:hypothetical protein ACGHAZ_002998 [Pseudomonas aeruginosa]|uniref:hypothetical protein n=1 Tax=Pseudomonas aeruginosa TaxID=287 RepID=UPI0003B972F2|nr:hypothetical protein [Pseudomonas aeruginosa]EIU1298262.1 hypothetical protein [Pseudomonas aeruginosa]EIU1443577.1 hypothetical protein [Pseudomonas aeruginosa]EIU1460067.1 hypothetical protein [Pseudomonas aeruginosa]EIU2577178.1 hypothetical protein [Pseudomonas aeruginosa]EIU2824879.1 hypothetical protein [Pseudomonas aeruginosa]
MNDKRLSEKLIYLDSDFISRLYESEFNYSPKTQITRTESIQASASLALFSGGGNSSESRSYSVSSLEMLDRLGKRLKSYPEFSSLDYKMDSPSAYCWLEGVLGVSKIEVTKTTHTITLIGKPDPNKPEKSSGIIGEEVFFSFKSGDSKFALSPTDQYFMSGIAALKGLTHIVVDRLSIPSRALVRVFSANTSFGEWIATPLVIYDTD